MESGFLSVSIFFVIDGKTVSYLIGSAVFFQPVYKSGLLVAFERKKFSDGATSCFSEERQCA